MKRSAKEGGRTPTRVTSLVPEFGAIGKNIESEREDNSFGGTGSGQQKAAINGAGQKDCGARTGIPHAAFRFGDRVVVVDGAAKGLEATIDSKARVDFGGIPVWLIRVSDREVLRCIRQDYLRKAAA